MQLQRRSQEHMITFAWLIYKENFQTSQVRQMYHTYRNFRNAPIKVRQQMSLNLNPPGVCCLIHLILGTMIGCNYYMKIAGIDLRPLEPFLQKCLQPNKDFLQRVRECTNWPRRVCLSYTIMLWIANTTGTRKFMQILIQRTQHQVWRHHPPWKNRQRNIQNISS